MKKRLKINGVIIFLVVLLVAIFPNIFLRKGGFAPLDKIAEIFGIAFILLGQVFRASARGYKSEHSRQSLTLIQGGPYELVRNPMYLGIFLIGLGVVLALFKWWVICIFLLVFIIRYILLIFKEEKKLAILFPQEYADYRKRVPRILPSVKTLLKADISKYLPLKVVWLKKEIGSMLAVLFFVLLWEAWEDIKVGGAGKYLNEAVAVFITIILFAGLVFYLCARTAKRGKGISDKSQDKTE
jgi:protein-S-isoprenylcysteine O-methyltransferase Ste14